MKTKMTMLLIAMTAFSRAQQLTLENSYIGSTKFGESYLGAGPKYYSSSSNSSGTTVTINLYNLNHSIYRSLIKAQTSNTQLNFLFATDSLFNLNPQVEYVVSEKYVPNSTYTVYIFNENGGKIDSIVNCTAVSPVKMGSVWKLVAHIEVGSAVSDNVYSLLGSMPAYTQPHKPSQPPVPTSTTQRLAKPQVSDPYPNPSAGKAIVGYELPEGKTTGTIVVYDIQGKPIKNYEVDATFNTLELDNTDLPSGTYFYQLQGTSTTRKMLIIK